MKKLWAILLVVAMLLTSAVAVAEEVDLTPYYFTYEDFPIYTDTETISLMGIKHPIHGDWDKLMFFQLMEQATGIHFDINTINLDGYQEAFNLAVNTESYAEVMLGCMLTNKQLVDLGSQGVLIPLDDYISEELTPNIVAFFDQYPNVKAAVTAPDGHIYALPQLNAAPIAYTGAMWVNNDWLEALGLTAADLPTDVDGLYDLLVRFRDEDPNGNGEKDEIALGYANGFDEMNGSIIAAFGIPTYGVYVDDDGKMQYGMLQEENMKAFLSYAKKLYDEDLIPKDFLTYQMTDITALGAEDRVGIAYGAIPANTWYFPDGTDSEAASKFPLLPAQSSSLTNGQQVWPHSGTGIQTGTFALTDLCEANGHVEAMMRWVDFLYSEFGSLLIHYGPEGYAYKLNEKGERVEIPPTDGRSGEERRGGSITPDCGIAMPKYVRPETEGNIDSPMQHARIDQVDEKLVPYLRLTMPQLFYLEDEVTELVTLETDLSTFVESSMAKFVTGELNLDDYTTEVVDKLNNEFKMDRILEIYQGAYDRYTAALAD